MLGESFCISGVCHFPDLDENKNISRKKIPASTTYVYLHKHLNITFKLKRDI